MIERVYIKDYLTFKEATLEFKKGLIVFTGPSGAGKSILMKGILSIFGYFEGKASLSEAIVDNKIDLEKYGLESDEILIFRQIKKNKNRYFINNQAISKKNLLKISNEFISYLSLREVKEFESENIINLLDKMIDDKKFLNELDRYRQLYKNFLEKKSKLKKIEEIEKNIEEKREFLKYEIEKINSINPKENEFEELMKIKKDLSKIEKLKEKATQIEQIFEYEYLVYEFLELIEENSEFFNNAMNELRIILDKVNEKAEFLAHINIEEVLNRLDELQSLIKRYGSIKAAIEYKKEKEKELEELENITFEKENLKRELKELEKELLDIAEYLHKKRKVASQEFEKKLNYFLEKLYMPNAKIILNKVNLNHLGIDKAEIIINEIDINTISTGEFNRLRVGLLASKLEYEDNEKILFLDEIDANLSGEESRSIAEVLKFLSKKYQILAISHQPQLSSIANQHFLVTKKDNISFVKELKEDERVEEISRIIGGKDKSKKAIEYAKELLKADND